MKRTSSATHFGDTSTRQLKILIVDDEPNIRLVLVTSIQTSGHQAVAASSSKECLTAIRDNVFDLCLLDLRLGVENGLDLIGPLHEAQPWLRIIVMTAFPGIDTVVAAMKLGATNYLSKPLTPSQIGSECDETISTRSMMEPAIAQPGLAAQAGTTIKGTPLLGFETSCPQMRAALETARAAAASGATILIQGEPGTGKRTLAGAIHGWSDRAAKPLVYCGCRGPTPLSVEQDWFGWVKEGRDHVPQKNFGRVAAASQGTIVFEEVGDLNSSLHAPLLRLLQRHEYISAREKVTHHSDARFIATASSPLEDAVKGGKFSSELCDALGVVTIDLPPLRRRARDIVLLAQAYARYFSRRLSKPAIGFDEAAVDAMLKHSWPGNVRELRNFVERAVMLSTKERIDLKEIPIQTLNNYASVSVGDRVTLERVEEMHIRAVIYASPSIEAAAQTLGMDTVTLWRRRKRYGIED